MFTTAAAIALTVGGAAAVSEALAPHPPHHFDTATASVGPHSATVRYGTTTWGGTTMTVKVTGFVEWTNCKFWVITKDGRRDLAGGWLVGPGGKRLWYPVEVDVPKSSVARFVISWGSHSLQIPADT